MTSEGFHEPIEKLTERTLDHHRAVVSLMEEFEAVDWYDQRAEACTDAALKEVLEHNRDEAKEHAAMLIEWLRRHDDHFAKELKKYLFRDGDIHEHEDE